MIQKITIFLLFCLTHSAVSANSPVHSPRRIEATFSFQVLLDNQQPDVERDLKYWMFLPREWENQKNVELLAINPDPEKKKIFKSDNLLLAHWNFGKQEPSKQYTVQFKIKADIYKVDHFIDPVTVPDNYKNMKKAVDKYLGNDSLAYITEEIREIAGELTRHVTDPFLKARNIYRWVLKHTEHQFPVEHRGTRYLLANPINEKHDLFGGDSAEYSWLFVALCRAANVPARPVTGFLAKEGWESPHTWAEFLLPALGWIPVDIFLADSREMLLEFSNQYDPYFYLGHLDFYHLTFYKGSQITLSPKCRYSAVPFIQKNEVWHAPVGIWNFNKLQNVNAFLSVNYSALLVKEYVNAEQGVSIDLYQEWLQQSAQELGPYLMKENFTNESKSVHITLVARDLPADRRKVDAEKAAHFEIEALKNLDPRYTVLMKNTFETVENTGFRYTALTVKNGKQVKESRFYISDKGYLYWLIISAEKKVFDQKKILFEKIMKSMKVDSPNRRMFR